MTSQPFHVVSIMEFEGARVVRETQYFSDPFEPGPSRAQWVERILKRTCATPQSPLDQAVRPIRGTRPADRDRLVLGMTLRWNKFGTVVVVVGPVVPNQASLVRRTG